jgi:hypothetical protein
MTKRYLKACCYYNALDFLIAIPSSWILLLAFLALTNRFAPYLFDQKVNAPVLTQRVEKTDLTFMPKHTQRVILTQCVEQADSPFVTNQTESVVLTQRVEKTDLPIATNQSESVACTISATTNLPPSSGKNIVSDSHESSIQLSQTFENIILPFAVLMVNYIMLLFCNPKRWFLAALLLPTRVVLCILAVVLNVIGFAFLCCSLGVKEQLGESARIAKDMRYKKSNRDKHRSDAIGFMIFFSIARMVSTLFFGINKTLLASFRSKNRQYTLLDDAKEVVQKNLVSNLEEQRVAEPAPTPKQVDVIAPIDVVECDIQANREACITNTDLRIDNDKSPLNFKDINDKYPQELLFFCISIASIIASKFFSPDVCAFVVLLFSIVHLITRGRVILRDGMRQRKYLSTFFKVFVLLLLVDVVVLFIMLAIIL